jgi:hypothetical protein
MMGKDGIARVYVVRITVLFLEREVPRQKKTDVHSVHNSEVTLCVKNY